jgi:hypothetical protein
VQQGLLSLGVAPLRGAVSLLASAGGRDRPAIDVLQSAGSHFPAAGLLFASAVSHFPSAGALPVSAVARLRPPQSLSLAGGGLKTRTTGLPLRAGRPPFRAGRPPLRAGRVARTAGDVARIDRDRSRACEGLPRKIQAWRSTTGTAPFASRRVPMGLWTGVLGGMHRRTRREGATSRPRCLSPAFVQQPTRWFSVVAMVNGIKAGRGRRLPSRARWMASIPSSKEAR